MNLGDFDAAMKDRYPLPGTRIKQYVVDERKDMAWERATCPRVPVAAHDDNTGAQCREAGDVLWRDLSHHDCCGICNDLAEANAGRADVAAWLAERESRPKPCADRSQLSEEIAPDFTLRDSPMLKFIRGQR